MKTEKKKVQRPVQHQDRQPGLQTKMRPQPQSENSAYRGSEKLKKESGSH